MSTTPGGLALTSEVQSNNREAQHPLESADALFVRFLYVCPYPGSFSKLGMSAANRTQCCFERVQI